MDIGKNEKNNFLLQNDQFFTKGVEIFWKHVFFSNTERLASGNLSPKKSGKVREFYL